MAKNKKTIEEFTNTVRQRLFEASKFWSDCYQNYHDLTEFISSLNALIQSLRNITFIIQSYKSLIPDFDNWYSSKQEEMRNNQYLKWAHKSRNTVVKSSNLKIKSKTTTELLNWESHLIEKIEIDPLTNNKQITHTVLAKVPKEKLVKLLREPLVKIERNWIADNLPEKEILSLLSYSYRYLKALVIELYKTLNLNSDIIENKFEKNKKILDSFSNFENSRTLILNLKDLKKMTRSYIRIKRDKSKKTEKKLKKRYGLKPVDKISKKTNFLELYNFQTKMVKKVLSADGHHISIIFFYYKNKPSEMLFFALKDRAEFYYAIRKFSDDIKEKKVNGIIIINEMWLKDMKFKTTGECVSISGISKDFFEVRLLPFSKKNNKTLIKKMQIIKEKKDMPFLGSIIEAINSVN